jgi:hypothetical protein
MSNETIKKQTNEENITKTQAGATLETKQNKHWLMISVNLILSLIAVYLFEFWFKQVVKLDTFQLVDNIAIVVLTALTYFIGKTYYIKGTMNTIKKIITLVFLTLSILALMLIAVKTPADVIYPFSGIIIVSVAFYMLSLTAGTLNTTGLVGLSLLFSSIIAFLAWFKVIELGTTVELLQLSVFFILFIGGTWAEIRAIIHGIRGVNKDGGGFGDSNDGDGDTGDE